MNRGGTRFNGTHRPIRDFGTVLEVTYKAQMAPWWTIRPGGNIARPKDPNGTQAMPNAIVVGLPGAVAF
jgi:porin